MESVVLDGNAVVQAILGLVLAVLGWFARELWAIVQKLKEEVSQLKSDLPKEYVQKDDYKQDIGRVHELLDRIYEKLENKADRHA